MEDKVVNAKVIKAAILSVKELEMQIKKSKKAVVAIIKRQGFTRKTNDYIEAQFNLLHNWIDYLDARLQLVEKMTHILSVGMVQMTEGDEEKNKEGDNE